MTAVLEIRLFGGLEIRQGDAPISGFISSKAPALLAYLVVTGQPHQRDALAALLWGEMSDADARNNLRQTLTNLRKLLEPNLIITRETVSWNTAVPHTLDAAQFENHLQTSRAANSRRFACLADAAILYRGDFLAGFYVRDAPDFEEWMLAQRVRYRELALHTLHTLTEHHLSRGEYGRTIDSAPRLLALDAWREEAHRQLMLSQLRSGQRSAALAQYGTGRQLLDQELGVEPSAETKTLFSRIQAAGQIPPLNLPHYPAAFVGRQAELADIGSLLLKTDCRLLTLLGPGGNGKTRLAAQAAECAWQHSLFVDGVFFVALEEVDTLLLTTAVAEACQISLTSDQEPQTQLLTHLRRQEMLLVLDNFEQLMGTATWLSKLLSAAPGIMLLITSRERLTVQWEWVMSVDGLPYPPPTASNLAQYSAVQLFMNRAQAVKPDLEWTTAVQTETARICQFVNGIPLGIELAAANLHRFTCAQIREAIAHNLDFLTSHYRDIPPRQRSLRAVFDYSWSLLSPTEQSFFTALSVFRGGFALEAAIAITHVSRPVLTVLQERSLLRRDERNGRYHLHDTLRQYAHERLNETSATQLQAAHAHYFANWLQQQEKLFFSPQQTEILAALHHDHDNLRAYWQWAVQQANVTLLEQGLVTLRNFYNVQSRFVEGRECLGQTAAALPTAVHIDDHRLQAKLLARWASFCAWSGQIAMAETLFQQALPLAQQFAEREELGFILLNWGYVTMMTSADYDLAEKQFSQSLAHYQQAEWHKGVADALSALGALYNVTGSWDKAKDYLQQSVAIARTVQDENGLTSSLTNLGNIYYLTGDLPQASRYYQEVLALCQKSGDREAEGIILSNLGAIANETADYATAERLLQQGVAIFQEISSPQSTIQATAMLSGAQRALGQFEEARQDLRQALKQALDQHLEHLVPHALLELGHLYEAEGQIDLALGLFYWTTQSAAAVAEHKRDAQEGIERLCLALSAEQVTVVQQRSRALNVNNVWAQLAAAAG